MLEILEEMKLKTSSQKELSFKPKMSQEKLDELLDRAEKSGIEVKRYGKKKDK